MRVRFFSTLSLTAYRQQEPFNRPKSYICMHSFSGGCSSTVNYSIAHVSLSISVKGSLGNKPMTLVLLAPRVPFQLQENRASQLERSRAKALYISSNSKRGYFARVLESKSLSLPYTHTHKHTHTHTHTHTQLLCQPVLPQANS